RVYGLCDLYESDSARERPRTAAAKARVKGEVSTVLTRGLSGAADRRLRASGEAAVRCHRRGRRPLAAEVSFRFARTRARRRGLPRCLGVLTGFPLCLGVLTGLPLCRVGLTGRCRIAVGLTGRCRIAVSGRRSGGAVCRGGGLRRRDGIVTRGLGG